MEKLSPESGTSPNVECFQNFTAPEVFVQGLAGMVNQQDTETIIGSQKYMLQRFEKTNEMLMNCNALSAARYQNAARDFKKHTALLQDMRKDVDNIFKRIRNIKAKISQQYPQAYELAATAQRKEKSKHEDDDEEDEEVGEVEAKPTSSSTSASISSIQQQQPQTPSRLGTFETSDSIDIPKKSFAGD